MWRFRCSICNLKKDLPLGSEKFKKCPKCGETHFLNHYEQILYGEVSIVPINPINPTLESNLKGGNEMAKKEKCSDNEKPVKEKEIQEKKKSITETRIENANKVLKYLKDLNIEEKEISKVLSRAYNMR